MSAAASDRLADPAMRAARAIDALRRGWPITITGGDGALHLLPAETAQEMPRNGGLLISASRAATLKLANQRNAASPENPVLIALPPEAGPDLIRAIIDPVRDLATPLKGPFRATALPQTEAAMAAMELALHAAILPGFLLVEGATTTEVAAADVAAFADPAALTIAAHARLPVAANAEAHIYGFRSVADASDHIALVVGRRDATPPLVRLHSECLTGDVLGSLKCDCGPQLDQALRRMGEVQWGVLLYLRQEGRGIGLINKLRAYALQDQGFDTVDANQRLGFAVDARDFSIAARMLELLGISGVRLLTNNPEKVAGLSAAGIAVIERVVHQIPANPHNDHYLATKRDRTGHQL